ncbi:MAG: hypothetical protein ACR2QM_01605 [Longimicrobiales bacterium]
MNDSRLPNDDAYWTELQARIVEAGTPAVDRYGAVGPPLLSRLSAAAPALAASAILAVLGSWALGGATEPPSPSGETWELGVTARALTPNDPLAQALTTPEPPYLGRFIVEPNR